MIEIGRICVKLAGRDAGRECVIVDILDEQYVLIDGNVRRRKCNILHIEPTSRSIELKKGASHEEVKKEFSKLKIPVWDTKPKPKTERPKKKRKTREQLQVQKEEKKQSRGFLGMKKKETKAEVKPVEAKPVEKKAEVKAEEKPAKKEEVKEAEKPKEKKPIDARVVSVRKKAVKKKEE